MSIEEVTAEETGKIAGILETKWAQMAADNSRLKAENSSLNTALDIMTQDRNYWRDRADHGERERDEARDECEFMMRQWQGVYAIAKETKNRHAAKRLAAPSDKPPSVVVFNRSPSG